MSTNNNDKNYEDTTKKQKLDDFVEGSIVKLKLKNFMTFGELKYSPQLKLNMIIGPNGSGKSSIVTALILGFGGNPKDINRGDKVSNFIKTGTTVAVISIELYRKSQENIHLKREILASNESCRYYINNILTTKKIYINVVESFNIKVHNLCQFLPQDRLEDFSKLDSKGLFLSALQSIENQVLLKQFNELTNLASNISTYEDDLKTLTKTINFKTSANLKLETIVSSFTKKNKLEQQLLALFQKRFWSLYILALKQIKKESKNGVIIEEYTNDALNLIKQQKNIITSIKSGKRDLLQVVLHNENILQILLNKLYETIDSAIFFISELNKLFAFVKNTSVRIEDFKLSIQFMEEKLKSILNEPFNIEDCKQEFAEINKKITNIDDCINPLKRQLDDVKNKLIGQTGKMYAIDQEIEREKRKEEGKNNFLQRKYPEIWKAMCWLRNCDKSSIFVGQVFDPLFTQIEVLDKKNANYIENIVNYRDMIAFVFEYAEDLTTFNKIIKQEGWQKINSISAPPANFSINETPNINISILRQFGFHSYALDMIKVPPIIRRLLVKNYDMHNIPIGSQEVINNLQHLPSTIGFFFAGNDQVIIRTSSYTGEKIIRQTQISNDAQFLLFSVDLSLIQLLTVKKKEASAECENFESQQSEFLNQIKVTEDSRQSLFARKKQIQGTFIKFQNRQNAYDKMIKDIDFARSELALEVEKITKFPSQYEQLINKYYVSMDEAIELFGDYSSHMNLFVASVIVINNNSVDMHDETRVLRELIDILISKENAVDKYLKYIQELQCEFNKIEETALYLTHGVSPYDKELFEPLKEKFRKIEKDDVDDIDLLIVEIKAKLNCLNINPKAPRIIEEYKDRKSQIKDLESKFNNLNNDVESKKSEIETIHSEWFPKLQELCNLLNENFQKFLISFGCCGVIELDVGITRYDYQAYGLLIKVQFRNEASLMMLDSKRQSGGERALTTALFLLTLQEITHFPFRIVDEINQGMDKIYEQKLMELFMELFENRSNQYFVVTPKLIKNLTFKNTTVDIIYCLSKV